MRDREYSPLEKLGLEAAAKLYFNCRRQVARTIVAFLVLADKPLTTRQLAKYMNWPDRPADPVTVKTVMSETRIIMRRVRCTSEIVNQSKNGFPASYIMSNKAELIKALRDTSRMK